MSITVACVLVKGHVKFSAEYVAKLRAMTKRLLPEHRFVCLTDGAFVLPPEVEVIRIPAPPRGVFGWWSKLHLFNPAMPLSGRVVYFDLDVLLLGGLMEIVDYPSSFAIVPDGAPQWRPKGHYKRVAKYNSSVMAWDHGAASDLYTDWDLSHTKRLWGDQDWIGERVKGAEAMPLEWFPRISQHKDGDFGPEAKVVLCKKPKNHLAVDLYPWFRERWA